MKKRKNTSYKFIVKKNMIIITVSLLVLFLFLSYKIYNSKENIMKRYVSKYYDETIRGKVIGIDRQIVTIRDLEKAGFNINEFKEKCNMEESFSYVILENPKERDIEKIKYTVENHLVCD